MKEALELLGDKFDKYHLSQLKLSEIKNADYYLLMGKAAAISEAMDLIEELINNKL